MKDYRKEAHHLINLGISIVPLKSDGSKRPGILWKEYQDRVMTKGEVENHFKSCTGIAAITGGVSKLLCIDFDTNKELPHQDYWSEYMKEIPNDLKKKMLVNRTRSGGYHIWLRTDYEDISRKLTMRYLTIPELAKRYNEAVGEGLDLEKVNRSLLNRPVECIIESRCRGSYAVILHGDYTRFYGDKLNYFSVEEVELLLRRCYELDCGFRARSSRTFKDVESYKTIRDFEDVITSMQVVELLESTGVYSFYKEDNQGNYLMKRRGSSNPYSAKVYGDTGIFYTFSVDILFSGDNSRYMPFEVYCVVNGLNEEDAIKKLGEKTNTTK